MNKHHNKDVSPELDRARRLVGDILKSVKEKGVPFDHSEVLDKTEGIAKGLDQLSKKKVRTYFAIIKNLLNYVDTYIKTKAGEATKVTRHVIVHLQKARAKAFYDTKRVNNKREREAFGVFANLFGELVDVALDRCGDDLVQTREQLQALSNFFECLVGYHYFYSKKD